MMRVRSLYIIGLAAFVALATVVRAHAQSSAAFPTATLRLSAERDTVLTLADFARLPRSDVRLPTAHRHGADSATGGATTVYSGVAVVDLLALVGAPREAALRGRAVASYLLIEAADGYRVVFSLDELAPEASATRVLLADRLDGRPLSSEDGPFRVIAPGARHSRWIRQVVRLSVRSAAP